MDIEQLNFETVHVHTRNAESGDEVTILFSFCSIKWGKQRRPHSLSDQSTTTRQNFLKKTWFLHIKASNFRSSTSSRKKRRKDRTKSKKENQQSHRLGKPMYRKAKAETSTVLQLSGRVLEECQHRPIINQRWRSDGVAETVRRRQNRRRDDRRRRIKNRPGRLRGRRWGDEDSVRAHLADHRRGFRVGGSADRHCSGEFERKNAEDEGLVWIWRAGDLGE